MLIVNKAVVKTKTPVLATNDANANTGNQSPTWVGINPSNQGVAANVAAGVGLSAIDVVANVSKNTVISKLISIDVTQTLTAAQDNFLRVPLSTIGLNESNMIIGGLLVGVQDKAAVANPSWINIGSGLALISVIKDALIIKIPNNNQVLFQNKTLSVLLMY